MVVGYFFLSALFVVTIAWQDVVERLAGYDTVELINRTVIDNFEILLRLTESLPITSYLASIFFWVIVGLIVYVFLWLTANTLVGLYNRWVLKTQYVNKGELPLSTLLEHAVRKVIIIGLPLTAFIVVWTMLPWVVARFKSALIDPTIYVIAQNIGGILLLSFVLHTVVVWFRVVAGRPDFLNSR